MLGWASCSEFLGCNLIFLTEAWFGLLNCGRYWLFLPKFCCRHFQLYLENERCGKSWWALRQPAVWWATGIPLTKAPFTLFWVCWSFLGNKSMFSVEFSCGNRSGVHPSSGAGKGKHLSLVELERPLLPKRKRCMCSMALAGSFLQV